MRRHCLVTGANRGIGLEFVRQLLAAGAHVVATCRAPGKATALNTLAGEHPGRLHVLPLDVADAKSRAGLVRELPLVLGDDGRLDLLVNNAGVLHSGERFGHVEAATLEDSLRTNAVGPFLLAQALVPWLREGVEAAGPQASGAVIANLSSVMASIGSRAEFRSPSYCASKAAQNMLSVQLAHALAPRGIRVLALHPGWVQTDMGGGSATVATVDAVRGLLDVLDAATQAQSGSFLDWRGSPIRGDRALMFHVILHRPEIPPNTGNVIRLCANTGASLHLVRPLGFDLDDSRLRRAGLDYHEYAPLQVHDDLDAALAAITAGTGPPRLFALSTRGTMGFDQPRYRAGDAFLFGSETQGLPQQVLQTIPEAQRLRLPMRPGNRSLNLSNAVAVVVFEAWRQAGFAGSS